MINIGLIGCGVVSKRYSDVFQNESIQNGKVIAVCDINEKLSIERSSELGANNYVNIHEMFAKENLDLVFILTISGLHYEHAKLALKHGIHTVVEKPLALQISDAEDLKKIANNKDLLLGVIFQNRFNNAVKYVKSLVDKNILGKRVLTTFRLRWCRMQEYYENTWHGNWDLDGGVIAQQAIHHMDIFQWLGGEIDSVSGTFTQRINNLEADDTTVGIVKFKDNSLGALEATTAARPIDYEASFSIIAEKGMVEIGGIALNKIIRLNMIDNTEDIECIIQDNSQEFKDGFGVSHGPYIQTIINNLENGINEAPVSADESIKSLKLVHAIYKSSDEKRWVKMNENVTYEPLGKK